MIYANTTYSLSNTSDLQWNNTINTLTDELLLKYDTNNIDGKLDFNEFSTFITEIFNIYVDSKK